MSLGPHVEISQCTVNCLTPEDTPDAHLFAVTVQRHRDGTWSLGDGGSTCYVQPTHIRDASCHTEHRYSGTEALRLAKEVAPHIEVNGISATDALTRIEAAR